MRPDQLRIARLMAKAELSFARVTMSPSKPANIHSPLLYQTVVNGSPVSNVPFAGTPEEPCKKAGTAEYMVNKT